MFAYCLNNPVNFSDQTGYYAINSRFSYKSFDGGYRNSATGQSASLRDVTEEINNALFPEAVKATILRAVINQSNDELRPMFEEYVYLDFYNKVNHYAPWDIKRPEPWKDTIGTTFPGYGSQVIYAGSVMTPESLGNYTYGCIGRAKGIPLIALYAGSYYAAGFPTGGDDLANELTDWLYITKGYFAYP